VKYHVVLLSAALLLAPVSALAADQNDADASCVFVGMRMSQSPDARTRAVSIGTIMYFMGKLDGRNPKFDLEPHLVDLQSHMTQDLLIAEAKRCEGEIAVRGNVINTVGRDLAGSAKPPPAETPPTTAPPTSPPAAAPAQTTP
jgi:hypothetical protein